MPWFRDPLNFLASTHVMERESRALDHLVDDETTAQIFGLARCSVRAGQVDLPRLDVDRAFFVAVADAGDDTAVALDYRTSALDPRVVASDIWTDSVRGDWRVVAETFSAFVYRLGLSARS